MHSAWQKLIKLFERQEFAIKWAIRLPFFSIFVFGFFMLPWFFALAVPASITTILAITFAIPAFSILNMIVGVLGLVIIAPWFVHRYFICVGLMLDRPRMAQAKLEYLEQKLASRS